MTRENSLFMFLLFFFIGFIIAFILITMFSAIKQDQEAFQYQKILIEHPSGNCNTYNNSRTRLVKIIYTINNAVILFKDGERIEFDRERIEITPLENNEGEINVKHND